MLKKSKNRVLGLALCLVLMVSIFTACGSQDEQSEEPANGEGEQAVEETYDVVVIGGGAAGLSASIEAAEAGANVVLLEKLPMVGGSTLLSGGIVYGVDSTIHQEAGVEDSVEDLVGYWSDKAEGLADEEFLTFVAERSGETIDWLVDLGVEFGEPAPMGTSPVPRGVSSPNRGAGLIEPLKAQAESAGVEIITETRATELITDDSNQVTGVKATSSDDEEVVYNAGAVVIASGGFDWNEDLRSEYAERAEGHTSFAAVGNEGDGLIMARDLGAEVISNGGVIGFRGVEGETSYTTDVCGLMWMPYAYVNLSGERFINETSDYTIFYEELIKQEDQVSYMIFDGNTYVEALDKAVEKGSAYKSDSLEDLAEQAGIDPEGLTATIENYNTMIENGEDTEFGKDLTGHAKVDTPDYYAVKVVPTILGTMSGLSTDLDTQVLDENGEAIAGLYAAGEVANGMFFNKVYPASGTSIQMSTTLGRVAGQNAAGFAK